MNNYVKNIKNLSKRQKTSISEKSLYWEQIFLELKQIREHKYFNPIKKEFILHPYSKLKLVSMKFYTPLLYKDFKIAYFADKEINELLKD